MAESIGDTAVNADPSAPGFTVKYGDYELVISDAKPATIAYLLQNGFSQSMTDAAALSKAQKMVATGEKTTDEDGKEVDVLREMTDDELAVKVKGLRDARFQRILEGTVALRTGGAPKQTTLERTIHAVATEMLRAALAAKKLSLPTKDKTITVGGKAYTREELIEAKINGKDKDAIVAEAQRRMSAVQEEVDLDEVL